MNLQISQQNGYSRTKIIIVFIIFLCIVMIIVIYGTSTSSKPSHNNLVEHVQIDDSSTSVASILSQITKHNPTPSPLVNHTMVPPIVPVPKSVAMPDENRFKIRQITTAKSLMYSNVQPIVTKLHNESSVESNTIVIHKSLYGIIKSGSVIPATTITGINSDLPGQVVAIVRENVYDSITGKHILIPEGAKLLGVYNSRIIYGQQRLMVAWNKLIYVNGASFDLKEMPGTDLAGYSGFHDQVDNKYLKIFGSSFIMGVITAGMQYSQNNTAPTTGYYNPTVGQTLAGGLGQQLGQTGLDVTEKNLNLQPTLIIRPNYPFNIMLTADLSLPYINE